MAALFFYCSVSKAQYYFLEISTIPVNKSLWKNADFPKSYADSISVLAKVAELVSIAREEGYLLADTKSLRWVNKKASVVIDLNRQYNIASVTNGNIPEAIFQQAGYSDRSLTNSKLAPRQLEKMCRDILSVYENSGYPFASVFLDSVVISQTTFTAAIFSVPGQLIVMDSLEVLGNTTVSKRFLESYLNIKEGAIYRASYLKDLEKRLAELPFMETVRPPAVSFSAGKAKVTLFAKKRNASQFDGILGVLPDNNSGKLQLTGDIKLQLHNAFKRAEQLNLSFKGLPGRSRELNLAAALPELFSSPLGIDLGFSLFKQDTNFQNIAARAGLNYRIRKGYLTVFLSSRSGAPIASIDSNSTDLPAYASLNLISYGTGWTYNSLNRTISPSRGLMFRFEGEAGRRKLDAGSIPGSMLDSIALKSSQYRIKAMAEAYFPLSQRGILKLGNETGILMGREFFENELFRIGGFGSLRGFDEQSILASNYSIFSLEYRLMIESRSFLFVFMNQGLVKRESIKNNSSDRPLGFGTGINLETGAGIFSISYALGKQRDNPLNLQRGKIHFGLITLF
ncbi:BamA/TamA family outer membrane protein [Desertivirga xinjiangensis]|uniref:BamA/TamA family outer membrane protein n=1 Tax=Desertivirga xinjiangensis TaxID=539206 RepID=UPI00210B13E4|nr:BamA/TamA family outer membrane protein [Pedobacter xinjiangensis]